MSALDLYADKTFHWCGSADSHCPQPQGSIHGQGEGGRPCPNPRWSLSKLTEFPVPAHSKKIVPKNRRTISKKKTAPHQRGEEVSPHHHRHSTQNEKKNVFFDCKKNLPVQLRPPDSHWLGIWPKGFLNGGKKDSIPIKKKPPCPNLNSQRDRLWTFD